jgi:hypothetical protein
MAINYPGPYELRLNYTTLFASVVYEHQFRHSFDCDSDPGPGSTFASYLANKRGGGNVGMVTWLASLIGAIESFFHTSTDFVTAEIWKYTPGTFNADFQSIETVADNGTSSLATQADTQTIISFRTTAGGVAKADFRNTIFAAGPSQSFPTAIGGVNTTAALFYDNNSIVIGRDGAFVFSPVKFLPGANERAFKRRQR